MMLKLKKGRNNSSRRKKTDTTFRDNYYFNCFSRAMVSEDSDSEDSDKYEYVVEYHPFLFMDFEEQIDRNYFIKINFISPFNVETLELQNIKIRIELC
ncbi:unnamed protein product [Moneuplotes crassus]|uniref:Uncharacterized protein n=1 Tax=Euplotes crassus TaxID=5936 RepID=A0AAD1UPH7_EUPCR|nr:unnamed protein product [Moneuplotes crassus]